MPRKFRNPGMKSLFRPEPVRHNQYAPNLNRPRKEGDGKARPKKKHQKRKHAVKSQQEKKTAASHKRSFKLDLPKAIPVANDAVPWITSAADSLKPPSHAVACQQFKIIPQRLPKQKDFFKVLDGIASESLIKALDEEILALARYVQLSPSEQEARHAWLDQLTKLVETTFSTHESPQLQVYGSFATPGVCTFASDIDTALWGVVPTSESQPSSTKTQAARKRSASALEQNDEEPSSNEPTKMASKESVRRRDKYLKWLEALESAPSRDDSSRHRACAWNEKTSAKEGGAALVVMAKSISHLDEAGSNSSTSLSSTAGDSLSEGPAPASVCHRGTRHVTESESDSDSDSSSNDDCDKLENYAHGRRREEPASLPSIRHTRRGRRAIIDSDLDSDEGGPNNPISLSCSDSESGTEDESDDTDMQVSFVANRGHEVVQKRRADLRMSRNARDACVSVLTRFANRLRKVAQTRRVELIKNARVPIIKMESNLGFEADMAIGGHNGTDTSAYAAEQLRKYKSFGPVVLLLKTILSQQKLDVPFHGGLGSYKLYVLVAYHIERHLSIGGHDSPSEIFLSFLYRYGNVNPHSVTHTRLSQSSPLRTLNGQAEADLSNVFLLDHCVDLFASCWLRMQVRLQQLGDPVKARPTTGGKEPKCSSALVAVINCQALHLAREEYGRKTRQAF